MLVPLYDSLSVFARYCRMLGPSRSMQRAPVAMRFRIESAISSPSMRRYHSLGSSCDAIMVPRRPYLASMISNRSTAFCVAIGVVMKSSMMSSSTSLYASIFSK